MQINPKEVATLAKLLDAEPITVEHALKGVARRLADCAIGTIDQGLIEAALIDYSKTVKKMSVAAHMHPRQFAREALDAVRG